MGWAPNYATTGELASSVRVGDTADDAFLELALAAASRAIDQATNRQFGRNESAVARYYSPRWDCYRGEWFVAIDDLMTTTDLAVAFDDDEDQTYGLAFSASTYQLRPVNAAADGEPWTRLWVRSDSTNQPRCIEDGMRITARWGWLGVPDPIRQACLLQASRLVARRDSPYGVAGSPETGSEVRLLAKLDPDVAIIVRPFRRVWGAV